MTPFEIFATSGHLRPSAPAERPAPRHDAPVDDFLARRALASVNTVERWVRRVFPG